MLLVMATIEENGVSALAAVRYVQLQRVTFLHLGLARRRLPVRYQCRIRRLSLQWYEPATAVDTRKRVPENAGRLRSVERVHCKHARLKQHQARQG
jgi:hypothetical protein